MKLVRSIARIMPLIAVILGIIQLVLTNQTAGTGKSIRMVDSAVDSLRYQNEILEQKVASASSLYTVEAKAKEIGFTVPEKSQYVTIGSTDLPVAFNR